MNGLNAHVRLDCVYLSVEIVSAYVSNNSVPPTALAGILADVYAVVTTLFKLESGSETRKDRERLTPAQIKKSITPDGLLSFEDGKRYKTLKRHLRACGLSPSTYRVKHGLPDDYPMVCANYSAERSELARSYGLGRIRPASPNAQTAPNVQKSGKAELMATKKRIGRPRKAAAIE